MLAALFCSAILAAPPVFELAFEPSVRPGPATGRAVLYLVREDSTVPIGTDPADGPFWDDPQPLFGVDFADLPPRSPLVIDDHAASFPGPVSSLPPGRYRAQAVFDLAHNDSNWRREPGNLYSDPVRFTINDQSPNRISITLNHTTPPPTTPDRGRAELFELRSKLLSDFAGRDIILRAGVLTPTGHDPARAYPAIYEVPGFGDNHESAWDFTHPFRARLPAESPWIEIRRSAFYIILDPESGNGHTLFADSVNNGPGGRALVEELIPALEAKYNLVARPEARLLRGHSSGGWSTLWLSITYPDTFGACWSSSPDPVDFRRFQLPDIYADENMYAVAPLALLAPPLDRYARSTGALFEASSPDGLRDIASTRGHGRPAMSIRTENAIEEVLGPDNTSGQQWDSWQAVFGPRNDLGHPAPLYDPVTGRLDHAVAASYRAYDIAEQFRADPARIGPIFQQRIRLVVGDQDTYFLDEAVALLKAELDKLPPPADLADRRGFITIVPGRDHGSIFASDELRAFPGQMLDHLRRNGFITP